MAWTLNDIGALATAGCCLVIGLVSIVLPVLLLGRRRRHYPPNRWS